MGTSKPHPRFKVSYQSEQEVIKAQRHVSVGNLNLASMFVDNLHIMLISFFLRSVIYVIFFVFLYFCIFNLKTTIMIRFKCMIISAFVRELLGSVRQLLLPFSNDCDHCRYSDILRIDYDFYTNPNRY